MKHYFYNEQPLVVQGRTIAYAVIGAQVLYKKAPTERERQVHLSCVRALEDLLRTFRDNDV